MVKAEAEGASEKGRAMTKFIVIVDDERTFDIRSECVYCHLPVTIDKTGTPVDDTEGDICSGQRDYEGDGPTPNENEQHVAYDHVVYLRTVDQALAWFAKWWTENENRPLMASPRTIDELWFDHDLGDSGEAIVVARFLSALNRAGVDGMNVNMMLAIDSINVHSQNPIGAENLLRELAGCAGVVTRQGLPKLLESEAERAWSEYWADAPNPIAEYVKREVERQHDPKGYDGMMKAMQYATALSYRLPGVEDAMHLAFYVKEHAQANVIVRGSNYRHVPVAVDGGTRPIGSDHRHIERQMKLLFQNLPQYDSFQHGPDFWGYEKAVDSWTKQLLEIHPWVDGNGRVASILRNWLLRTLENPTIMPYYFVEGE